MWRADSDAQAGRLGLCQREKSEAGLAPSERW